jgi:hypothetical protein
MQYKLRSTTFQTAVTAGYQHQQKAKGTAVALTDTSKCCTSDETQGKPSRNGNWAVLQVLLLLLL